ncbi:MAG: citrate/2-methylcitrate synthase [Thermoleophilia bacterium]|nr:citrate/2-methylcitrate synthase [Thermoleophilia bacterium]
MAGPKKSVALSGVSVAETSICSIDPDAGVLMYRGYDIAELAEHSSYEEVAYLLLHGELPENGELEAFREQLAAARELPRAVTTIVDGNAMDASPMETLRTAVSALSFSDPAEDAIDREHELRKAVTLIAQLPTIVARYERRRRGEPGVDPDPSLGYAENFLTMLRGESPTAEEARAFEIAMILHAEHEMNASTFTARVVAGTNADLHSAIVAAVSALKGPLHGGANQAAMQMFAEFGSPERVPDAIRERLEAKQPLYGFGHPLYRAMDPRAPILRRLAEQFADEDARPDFLEIAKTAEREAREQKGLWPNVDLYSGVLYHELGIPTDLFIPLFQMSRVAGQAAHVLEQHAGGKIIRPSAEYVGEPRRDYPVREPR